MTNFYFVYDFGILEVRQESKSSLRPPNLRFSQSLLVEVYVEGRCRASILHYNCRYLLNFIIIVERDEAEEGLHKSNIALFI